MRSSPVAAVYTRGLNPPYTEGHVALARSIARAITLTGWTTLVLNFRYSGPDNAVHGNTGIRSGLRFEVRIPGIGRNRILHERNSLAASVVRSSILESALVPLLFAHELCAKTSLVHLVNCFMLPRMLVRLVKRTPVIAHVYQIPTEVTTLNLHLRVDAYVASSKRIAKYLESHYSHRCPVFVVPPAVDAQYFEAGNNLPPLGKIGLYVGNLSENRFPDELLEVLARIIRMDSDVAFRLIAPINQVNFGRAQEIVTMCRKLRIDDRVDVLVQNMDDEEKLREYSAAKFFLFAPARECQEAIEPPLTLLEALASGLPVLATDTYSASEAVTSGKNGFVVDASNYLKLAELAIEILQADASQWHTWSLQARRSALDNYSLSVAARKLSTVHSSVLGN